MEETSIFRKIGFYKQVLALHSPFNILCPQNRWSLAHWYPHQTYCFNGDPGPDLAPHQSDADLLPMDGKPSTAAF
jgi:hypothetical protein